MLVTQITLSNSMNMARAGQDNSKHTYNSASCHQITEGTDNVHVGIQGNTEGGGEQSHGADDNGRNGYLQGVGDSFTFVPTFVAFLLVSCGHQNSVVHSSTQLNRTDTDRGNERK